MTREEKLSMAFNDFWRDKVGIDDLYGQMSIDDFVHLKKALSSINNIITLQVSCKFVEELAKYGLLSQEKMAEAINEINRVNANANGYDVRISDPDIVAEVKCNIPVGGTRFGAAQESGIEKDIQGLLTPGLKKGITDSSNYLKFMVLLDVEGVRTAMQNFMRIHDESMLAKLPSDMAHLSKDKIYICYVKP